jgi:N-methylhydantoinase A
MVNLRVRAVGRLRDEIAAVNVTADGDGIATSERIIDILGQRQLARVYERERLAAGQRLAGPAVVEQADATIVIPSGWAARVDPYGNLVIEQETGP